MMHSFLIFVLFVICIVGSRMPNVTKYIPDPLDTVKHLPKIDDIPRCDHIPKTIMLTTRNKATIPEHIHSQYKKYASDYEVTIFDDNDCVKFLEREYHPDVVNVFNSLKAGAHKADLFRYAYLFKRGGIYFDIKTILVQNLNEIIDHDSYVCYMVYTSDNVLYNGVLCTPPANPIFLDLVDDFVYGPPVTYYMQFCTSASAILKRYLDVNTQLRRGLHICKASDVPNVILWREMFFTKQQCPSNIDRYGRCSYIIDVNNTKIFGTRDPSYGIRGGWM